MEHPRVHSYGEIMNSGLPRVRDWETGIINDVEIIPIGRNTAMANYVILDTETAPTVNHKDNKAHPETSLVYDFGYTIRDCNGCELVGRSFIIAETFTNVRMMNSAYYAEKLPQYHAGMGGTDDSEWRVVSFMEAWQTFKADCKLYDVKTAWAYNAKFDLTALNNTIRTYSNGYVRFFLPYKMKMRDIWDYASNVTATRKYVSWCIEHGYFTASGNPMTGAEVVYRYLTQDVEFIERHTAYSDACIEWAILSAAKRKHSKTRHSMGQGWRDAAKVYRDEF